MRSEGTGIKIAHGGICKGAGLLVRARYRGPSHKADWVGGEVGWGSAKLSSARPLQQGC